VSALLRALPATTPERTNDLLLGAPVRYQGTGTQAGVTVLTPDSLASHQQRHGPRPSFTGGAGDELISHLERVGLDGRGGAHFPVARKWRAVRDAAVERGESAVVVANGAEGEPLSVKDVALLELRPHLVLDGLACAAEALGSDDAFIWLHEGAHAARAAVTRALSERAQLGFGPRIRLRVGPDRYLTGESSAVVQALSGGPALPTFGRVPAAVSGIGGRPTLVQNVETLARVAIAARGRDALSSVLLSIAAFRHRVVIEAPATTSLHDAITSVSGSDAPEAVLVGGYGGRWARWVELDGLSLAEADLQAHGRSLGAGVLLVLPAGECGISWSAGIAGYLADSSARQCGPCLFGLRAIAEVLDELAATTAHRRDTRRLERFIAEVTGRGGCHHPDGAAGMVASALTAFADDVAAHLHRRCLARPATKRQRRG